MSRLWRFRSPANRVRRSSKGFAFTGSRSLSYSKRPRLTTRRFFTGLGARCRRFSDTSASILYFTSACFVMTVYVAIKHGFDVIHAHNPPDTLFLVALPFKLLGKRFVFDHHDLSPELYMSRYGAEKGVVTRMLAMAEWCSVKLADVVIATNESYKTIVMERANKDPRTIFVVGMVLTNDTWNPTAPNPQFRLPNKSLLCYVGDLNPQDGLDYLLRSLHHLIHGLKRADFHCVIMGSGDSLEDLRALAAETATRRRRQVHGLHL